MAKQTKAGTAKKTATKKNEIVVSEPTEETEEVIEATEVGVDIDKISKAIDNLDVNLEYEKIGENDIEGLSEFSENLKKISENQKTIEDSKAKLTKELDENPENAKSILDDEITKMNDLKEKLEAKISSTNKVRFTTNWWNGMGYDL